MRKNKLYVDHEMIRFYNCGCVIVKKSLPSERFYTDGFWPDNEISSVDLLYRELANYDANEDILYTIMTLCGSVNDVDCRASAIARMFDHIDVSRCFDNIRSEIYNETQFEKNLRIKAALFSEKQDEELKEKIVDKLEVCDNTLLSLPADKSVIYSKINHGYWEFMLSSYANEIDNLRYRKIDLQVIRRRVELSGLTQHLGYESSKYFERVNINTMVSLDWGIANGEETFEHVIRRPFNPVTRGATAGLLSFTETINPLLNSYTVGDGTSPRALILKKEIEFFYEKFIRDSDACLFLVPPHLREITLTSYKGDIHKLILPETKLMQNWKVYVNFAVGCISQLLTTYKSLVVLSQGSTASPLLGLMLSRILPVDDDKILRFFDVGQLLDIGFLDKVARQNWAHRLNKDDISRFKKIFSRITDVPDQNGRMAAYVKE